MKVIWTPEVDQDRLDVRAYIATDNPRAAAKMSKLFRNAASQLSDFPKLGRVGKVPGTRELTPHPNYRLMYEVDEVTDTVWVQALSHAARQWPPIQE